MCKSEYVLCAEYARKPINACDAYQTDGCQTLKSKLSGLVILKMEKDNEAEGGTADAGKRGRPANFAGLAISDLQTGRRSCRGEGDTEIRGATAS